MSKNERRIVFSVGILLSLAIFEILRTLIYRSETK